MNELQTKETALPTTARAVDARRVMKVTSKLTDTERNVWDASTKELISDAEDAPLAQQCANMFRYIAIDTGYNIPSNVTEWQYTCIRLMEILKKYYGYLSLAEVKLAFELTMVGELDKYLPKDGNGNASRSHYQNFNIEYLSKVLTAYGKMRSDVFHKVYTEAQIERKPISDTQRAEAKKKALEGLKLTFLKYKYTGRLETSIADGFGKVIYDWLKWRGLITSVEVTEEDRRNACVHYLSLATRGLVSKFSAIFVKKNNNSEDIAQLAEIEARKKQIAKAFDYIIAEGFDITHYTI